MSFDELPIIVVSARTETAADEFITELIEDDVTVEVRPPDHASTDRVWRLLNRYYTADVRVQARAAPAAPAALPGVVGAHVQLLEEAEAQEEQAVRARLDAVAWLGGRSADIGVVAYRAHVVPGWLVSLCARRLLEPVALLDAQEGVAAVRTAVHAHVWPGMRRRRPEPREPDSGSGSLGSSLEDLRLNDPFVVVLDALGPGARAVREMHGAQRLLAAERLVALFAAALGPDANL